MLFPKYAIASALCFGTANVKAEYRLKLGSNEVSGASSHDRIDIYVINNKDWEWMHDAVEFNYLTGFNYDCDGWWISDSFETSTHDGVDDFYSTSILICNRGDDGLFIDQIKVQKNIGLGVWNAFHTFDAKGGNCFCLAQSTANNI